MIAGVEISVVTFFTVVNVLMFSLPTSDEPSSRPYPIFDPRISSSITLRLAIRRFWGLAFLASAACRLRSICAAASAIASTPRGLLSPVPLSSALWPASAAYFCFRSEEG